MFGRLIYCSVKVVNTFGHFDTYR